MGNRKSIYRCSEDVEQAVKYLKAGMPIIIFDLETTGLSVVEDRILSFSAVKCFYKNGLFTTKGTMNIFINPERPIPEAASSVNHITDERVKDCPTEDQIIDEIIDFVGDSPMICGFNNKKFDTPMLKNTYLRTRGIELEPVLELDVLEMSREKLELPHYHLSDVAHIMGVDGDIEFHNSLDDVLATFRIFQMLLTEYHKEEERPLIALRVKEARYWKGHSHYQNRLYISTYPYSKTYYDVYRKEWKSDINDADLGLLEKELFRMYEVSDINQLIKKIQQL